MDQFARFKKEIKFRNGEVLFKKDDGTKGTRYLVLTENEVEIYVATLPNNFRTSTATRFPKDTIGDVLILVEED